jgi:hypothetical protein
MRHGREASRHPDFDSADDLKRLSPSALKLVVSLAEKWPLGDEDARLLLGGG